jgi:hypothetical protein
MCFGVLDVTDKIPFDITLVISIEKDLWVFSFIESYFLSHLTLEVCIHVPFIHITLCTFIYSILNRSVLYLLFP